MKRVRTLDILIAVLVFVFVTDPSNSLFRMKEIALAFVVFLSILKYRNRISKYYIIPIVFIFILIYSTLSANILGENVNVEYQYFIYKGVVVWLLLMWINRFHFVECLTIPLIILSILTIMLLYALFVLLQGAFLAENLKEIGLLYMYGWREFIGIEFACVFFKTTPLFIIVFSIYTYKILFLKRNVQIFIIWLLFLIPLLFAGTRACILSSLSIIALFLLLKMRRTYAGKSMSNILLLCFCVGGLYLLNMLLQDEGDRSVDIKMGHLSSYINLFQEKPYILFSGQGVGSIFYSTGRAEYTYLTEWSYMELLRNFGVLGAVLILTIYLYPLHLLFKKRNERIYAIPLFWGYLFYLLIAGTNPLLLGSTGYLAMLVVYSYATNSDYKNRDYSLTI